jgi:hypothetical protein
MLLKLDTSENISEIPANFLNLVQEKEGEVSLDRSCENEEV